VLVEQRDHRHRHDAEPQRRRRGEQEHQPQRRRERRLERGDVVVHRRLRERRQAHGRERDAEDADRQLHEPERVPEPRHAALLEIAGDDRADEQVDLRAGEPDRRRQHEQPDAAHGGMAFGQLEPEPESHLRQRRQLDHELAEAAEHDAERHGDDRRLAETLDHRNQADAGDDHAQVEERRRQRRHRERSARVEHPHRRRRQRNARQERQHDAGQEHGQLVLARDAREAGREHGDQPGREQVADEADHRQHQQQRRHELAAEVPRLAFAAAREHAGERGHERRGHGAFGEQVAQQVGQPESDVEGVGRESGAEERRHHLLADESEDTRQHGRRADDAGATRDLQLLAHARVSAFGTRAARVLACAAMTALQAAVLGVVQGLTEFLPVSSSAHLYVVPKLLGWTYAGVAFDVALHWGTLLALLAAFWRDWLDLLRGLFTGTDASRREARATWAKLIVCSVPAALAGLMLQDAAETRLRSLPLQAAMLAIFGFLLWWMDRSRPSGPPTASPSWGASLAMGTAQALALVPGVSRSGVTITAGRAAGVERVSAARFSFLLATPITFGAGLVELRHLSHDLPRSTLLVGVLTAALTGFFAIRGLIRWLGRAGFGVFFAYRVALAALIVFALMR
jgi:undecaprenyl-diphosphatase